MCGFIPTFYVTLGYDMKKFDFIALYLSLKLTYSVNGEFAINEMLRFVDEYHQDGFLDYFEWKELRRVVLERDFSR